MKLKPESGHNTFFIMVSAGIVILFYILNISTPLTGDDFSYSNGISSISDVVNTVRGYYSGWGGRIVGAFLSHFSLFLGKNFFNIANTIIYAAFILLIQFHIVGAINKLNSFLFFAITIYLWFFVEAWGQVFLWPTGTTQYSWTLLLILAFLVPYRRKLKKAVLPFQFFYFIFAVIAGCTNENSGAGILFFLAAYFILKYKSRERFNSVEIVGAIGFLVGYLILICAPGNYVRFGFITERNQSSFNSFGFLIERFIDINYKFLSLGGLFLLVCIVFLGYIKVKYLKEKISACVYLFALAGVAANYSMLLAPGYPDRAFFGVTVFLGIALGVLISEMHFPLPAIIKNHLMLFSVLAVIAVCGPFINSSRNLMQINKRWKRRIEYILSEKAKGNLDIVVKAPIPAIEPHAAFYGKSPDILSDPDQWPNTDMAIYYGINSIRGEYNTEEW